MDRRHEDRGSEELAARAPEGGDAALRHSLARAFARSGGAVREVAGAGNLVRRALPADGVPHPFVVEVEGLPNLLHEFVHFVLRPPLAVDHGFEYRLIPFDTAQQEQRRWLWEELACCVVSCAYLAGRPERVEPWFAEQLEIQHHFYGFPGPEAFRVHVGALVAAHGPELDAVVDEAYAAAAAQLAAAGASDPAPPRRLSFLPLFAGLPATARQGSGPG